MVVSIVTELCPMSLSKLIDSIIINESLICQILRSILIGVYFCFEIFRFLNNFFFLFYEVKKLKFSRILKYFLGLKSLHDNGIAHRDVKSDNVLISENGAVYVSDLGYCDSVESDGNCAGIGLVGTPHWMAPEGVYFCNIISEFLNFQSECLFCQKFENEV